MRKQAVNPRGNNQTQFTGRWHVEGPDGSRERNSGACHTWEIAGPCRPDFSIRVDAVLKAAAAVPRG